MNKVLFVIPGLEYGGAAKQMLLLAAGLPRAVVEPTVCVLGQPTPWAAALAEQGVRVECLGWRRRLDVRPLVRLRELIREVRPDAIHAWRLPALRALAALGGVGGSRLIVSAALRGPKLAWWDRWLLRRADCVVVSGPAEAERGRRLGVPVERLVQVPPGVTAPMIAPAALREELGIAPETQLIVGVGPFEPRKGFLDAVWALDILRYLYDDLHLVLVGRGSEQPRLEEFVAYAALAGRVHFRAPQTSVLPLLAAAEVVWAPSRKEAGINAVLEAMTLARPVLATRLPGLAEVVADGETGCLITPGDKADLARQTRLLLDDPERRARLGAAGRERALGAFSARSLVERSIRVYSG